MEYPTSAARHANLQASAGSRRIRNGSTRHSAYTRGTTTNPTPITDQRRLGKIVNKNAAVSRSMTMMSTKFAVICTMSCLSRDSRISTITNVNDSAPERAGRRSSVIQNKLRIPQASRNPIREPKSVSVCSMIASAARCGADTASSRQTPTDARPAAATLAEGPGIGAGAIG